MTIFTRVLVARGGRREPSLTDRRSQQGADRVSFAGAKGTSRPVAELRLGSDSEQVQERGGQVGGRDGGVGRVASEVGDRTIIDGFFVNGTAKVVGIAASLMRLVQSGYVYHYAFTMIVGVFALLTWWVGH